MKRISSLSPRALALVALALAAGACGGDKNPDVTTDSGAAMPTGFPCDVQTIIKTKCQTCHGETLQRGAPVHLLTYADTQIIAPDDPKKHVWEYMESFIMSGFMPLAGSPTGPLDAAQKATMLAWLAGGPVASTATCP
jgi:hypothetical protein